MTPTSAQKNGGKRYRYYVCQSILKRGRAACPTRALPCSVIESWVIEQVRGSDALASLVEVAEKEPAVWLRSRIRRVDYDGTKGKVLRMRIMAYAGESPFAFPVPRHSMKV
jgi:hypothetical protein